jgi:hypothetical protein
MTRVPHATEASSRSKMKTGHLALLTCRNLPIGPAVLHALVIAALILAWGGWLTLVHCISRPRSTETTPGDSEQTDEAGSRPPETGVTLAA